MGEFDLIERLRAAAPAAGPGLALGIGDDAALIDVPAGLQLVACTDTLNAGIHFPADTAPAAIGHKALAVNLSDLAAMGARPAWALLNLSLPDADPAWLDDFTAGLAALARETGTVLAGGDTTRGPLSVTVTALGLVPTGCALTRAGARAGDLVVVSGTLGDAAHALHSPTNPVTKQRLDYPAPRLALGQQLRGVATACIDVSDGLAADLGHILSASGVGARLAAGDLPASEPIRALSFEKRVRYQLTGGDDYELCFTLPPEHRADLAQLAEHADVPLTVMGEITPSAGLVVTDPDGHPLDPAMFGGFDHFAGKSA